MTIDMLNEITILVTLAEEDLQRYELDFTENLSAGATRRGLTRLMVHIGEECGLDHRDKSYLIEALPGGDGCLLIISVHKRRRVYRIKREKNIDCCRFDSADDLLAWLSEREPMMRLPYSLYCYEQRYILIPELPLTPLQSGVLSEYGRLSRESSVSVARVREHGQPVLNRSFHRVHLSRGDIGGGSVTVRHTASGDPGGRREEVGDIHAV